MKCRKWKRSRRERGSIPLSCLTQGFSRRGDGLASVLRKPLAGGIVNEPTCLGKRQSVMSKETSCRPSRALHEGRLTGNGMPMAAGHVAAASQYCEGTPFHYWNGMPGEAYTPSPLESLRRKQGNLHVRC